MTYTTRTPEQRKEQVSQRKPPSRFAKFMVMTSVLAALGGTPSNAMAFGGEGAGIETNVQSTSEHTEAMRDGWAKGLTIGAILTALIAIKTRNGRRCGPWGMDLKEWNKHLEQMKRKREEGSETNPSS